MNFKAILLPDVIIALAGSGASLEGLEPISVDQQAASIYLCGSIITFGES